MTTLIINIKNSDDAQKIADALRLMDSVADITIEEDNFERIPGFPYTDAEKIASVRQGMVDIHAGRTVSMDEMRAKHPRT